MYQPLHIPNERHQPVAYAVPSSAIRERHATAQLMVAGIIPIVAGILSIVAGILSIVFNFRDLLIGEGTAFCFVRLWCAIMVGLILCLYNYYFYGAFCKCKL